MARDPSQVRVNMPASRTLVILCAMTLLFAVLLAGCIDSMQDLETEHDEDQEEDESPPARAPVDDGETEREPSDEPEVPSDGPNGDNGNGNGGNGDDDNETKDPPTADLTADTTSGTAPLKVTFTLDGSTDTQVLNWSFDPGDGSDPINGTELPTTHEHEYDEPGSYTAVLTVSDGEETTQDDETIAVDEEEETIEPDAIVDVLDNPPSYSDETTGLPLSVTNGTLVQWQWEGGQPHSVTSDVTTGQEFDSGIQQFDENGEPYTFEVTFDAPGIYKYFCQVHLTQHGVIIVLPDG